MVNAETDYERLIANTVKEMMNNGKVQIDNISNRHERFDYPQKERRAFFGIYKNTETENQRVIIVLDIDFIVNDGLGETIEALSHEAWHKVQYDCGLFILTDDNYINLNYEQDGRSFYDHFTDIECDAFNMGLAMHNKYLIQQNLQTYNWYDWNDIRSLYPED